MHGCSVGGAPCGQPGLPRAGAGGSVLMIIRPSDRVRRGRSWSWRSLFVFRVLGDAVFSGAGAFRGFL